MPRRARGAGGAQGEADDPPLSQEDVLAAFQAVPASQGYVEEAPNDLSEDERPGAETAKDDGRIAAFLCVCAGPMCCCF